MSSLSGGSEHPLVFFVAPRMRTVELPAPSFADPAAGQTVLFLPWGSGPMRAGLAPGNESATLGPSSFDVDAEGRIFLLDGTQGRLAVFSGGRLVRESTLAVSAKADLAVTADGSAYVMSRTTDGAATARRIGPEGDVGEPTVIGAGIPAEIRASGDAAYAHLLPVDAWLPVRPPGGTSRDAPTVGRPVPGGSQLLSVVHGDAVRLGLVRGGVVRDAVELRSSAPLGELALADRDGHGGYWVVVRVWRDGPSPADQYQVAHVAGDGQVSAFGAPSAAFADTATLSRFRLGGDGDLYQITSSPEGMRIVRYQTGGDR
jgi:hypothetical protein